jgi:endonuclease III
VEYVSKFVTGLWHEPLIRLRENHPPDLARKIDFITNSMVLGIRVPWLREHKWQALLTCMLSIHTRMDLSRKWFETLSTMTEREFLRTDPMDLRQLTKDKTGISAGYRMRYIVETVKDLFEKYQNSDDPLEALCRNKSTKVRTELTRVRNIGPKVADCFVLNVMGDLSAAPIDVNVKRVAEYLQLVPKDLGMPTPMLCRNFACRPEDASSTTPLCPKTDSTIEYLEGRGGPEGTCIRAAFSNTYSDAEWVQAEVFAFARTFCVPVSPPCASCLLKPDCRREEVLLQRRTTIHRPRAPSMRLFVTNEAIFVWRQIDLLEMLPEHCETVALSAKELFDRAVKLHGRPVGSTVLSATCAWLACRLQNLPITLEEVVRAYGVPKETLACFVLPAFWFGIGCATRRAEHLL